MREHHRPVAFLLGLASLLPLVAPTLPLARLALQAPISGASMPTANLAG